MEIWRHDACKKLLMQGVHILKQQKRKKWWRGQWGKLTYETKGMQKIEGHRGKGKNDVETG